MVGVILGALLASFLMNFVAQLWPAARRLSFLGILHYYQPLPVVRTGDWPVRNIVILLSIAPITWSLGLWRFTLRDIRAV